MKSLFILFTLLGLGMFAKTQTNVGPYTINADTITLASCDSTELLLRNHTDTVPGFLFNTGHGLTAFKRGLQSIGSGGYIIGADTLRVPSNAWLQGGNAFGALGQIGTLDTNKLDLLQAGTTRLRIFNGGNISIASLANPGYTLYDAGNLGIGGTTNFYNNLIFHGDSTANVVWANSLTFETNNNLGNSYRDANYIFTNLLPDENSGGGTARLIHLKKLVNRGYEDGPEVGLGIDFTVTGSAGDLRAVDAGSGNVVVETGNVVVGAANGSTSKVDITGTSGFSQLRLRTQYTPTSSSDPNGNTGDTAVDDNYFYYKTTTGWKRVALGTF